MFFAAFRTEISSRALLGGWLGISGIAALTGPFGSYLVVGFPPRLAFWLIQIGIGVVTTSALRVAVRDVIGIKDFLTGAILTALLATCVLIVQFSSFIAAVYGDMIPTLPGWFEMALEIFTVSLGLCILRETQLIPPVPVPVPLPEVVVDTGTDTETKVQPRLAGRLEPDMRGTLISISVRDHYVDVRTDKGRSSLLLRLSDAIDETAPIDGAQVHRSHWVAWEAVQAVERKGDKVLLRLSDGDPIPVSRNYRVKLEARGLI